MIFKKNVRRKSCLYLQDKQSGVSDFFIGFFFNLFIFEGHPPWKILKPTFLQNEKKHIANPMMGSFYSLYIWDNNFIIYEQILMYKSNNFKLLEFKIFHGITRSI